MENNDNIDNKPIMELLEEYTKKEGKFKKTYKKKVYTQGSLIKFKGIDEQIPLGSIVKLKGVFKIQFAKVADYHKYKEHKELFYSWNGNLYISVRKYIDNIEYTKNGRY